MSAGYIDSYYSRAQSDDRRWPVLRGEVDCDICVIGGGLAGLNTALGLAQRGRRVVLLEGRRVAWGASGRNGGFVSPGYALSTEALAARVGMAQARRLYGLTVEAMALIRRRIAEQAIDCGPLQDGIVTAAWRGSASGMRAHVEFMNAEMGATLRYWPEAELRENYCSDRYGDACFAPDGLHLNALNFARGIAGMADRAGVAIHEGTTATALRRQGDSFTIDCAEGRVRAEQIVLCMSGYATDIQRRIRAATLPVATYVMLTEPAGEALAASIRAPYAIADSRRAGDYYRALPDGRILWGGRVSTFRTPPARLAETMLGDMRRVYPALRGIGAEVAWDGLMGYASHRMPQIGRLEEGIWYCMGFGGKGLCATTMGGEVIARAIAEGDESWRLFQAFPLGFAGGPLKPAIAQLAYWWMQLRDTARI